MRRRRRRRGLGAPPVWVADVVMRCPSGEKTLPIVGPSSAAALKKAVAFKIQHAPAAYMRQRCVKVGARLRRGTSLGADKVR